MDKPNVLLLVLDSARPDVLSPYSSEANTPNIEQLADEGIVFDNAFAPSSWTAPSHASMFSGQRPSKAGGISPEPVLQCEETIASSLSKQGYRSAGLHTAAHITKENGFDQGFDTYKDVRNEFSRTKSLKPAMWLDTVLNRIWGRKDRTLFLTHKIKNELSKEGPKFLFANYQTVHRPYRPSLWARRKTKTGVMGEKARYLSDASRTELDRMAGDNGLHISENTRQDILNTIRAEAYRADFYIGRVIQKLKNEGEYEDTLIVLTSDHGNEIGENNLFEHGHLTYNTLRVPLIVGGGAVQQEQRIERVASLVKLKQMIENFTRTRTVSTETLGQKAVSERGEKNNAANLNLPSLDASISVVTEDHQLIKRRSFDDSFGTIENQRVDFSASIPENEKSSLVDAAGGFRRFPEPGKNYSDVEDEKVKSKLKDLGYL